MAEETVKPIAIETLPPLAEVLRIEGHPAFMVLKYTDFVKFSARNSSGAILDVVSVLDCAGEHEFVVIRVSDFRGYISVHGFTGRIDERHYLTAYPDVRAAVEQGKLANGSLHYVYFGYLEQRSVCFEIQKG